MKTKDIGKASATCLVFGGLAVVLCSSCVNKFTPTAAAYRGTPSYQGPDSEPQITIHCLPYMLSGESVLGDGDKIDPKDALLTSVEREVLHPLAQSEYRAAIRQITFSSDQAVENQTVEIELRNGSKFEVTRTNARSQFISNRAMLSAMRAKLSAAVGSQTVQQR